MKGQFIYLFMCIATTYCHISMAQNMRYDRAMIIVEENSRADLARLGLELDHGDWQGDRYFTSDFSEEELQMIRNAGFKTRTLISDVSHHYAHGHQASFRNNHCSEDIPDITPPDNFRHGSIAGYYSYEEILEEMERMHTLFPDLVSRQYTISDTLLTHEGREVYWYRVSDNPEVNEEEPEVLYTALHHAREPMSALQLIYFLWYCLENYENNERIRYLLNETEMYVVPCLNPDGYLHNETMNPNGGGLWRKNRRQNMDGTFGVDLNRNYGYEWGHDDEGSSPDPSSQVYRGPDPFSEPETRMMKLFCESHDFQIALNHHSFGNLLIYPFGYGNTPAPDLESFDQQSRVMTRQNGFLAGTGTATVGYFANGNSDDWMYGDTEAKNKIYSFTPESGPGTQGFWPAETEIESIAQSCLEMNITAAELLLDYTEVDLKMEDIIMEKNFALELDIRRIGLQTSDFTVSWRDLDDVIVESEVSQTYTLAHLDTGQFSAPLTLSPLVEEGQRFRIEMTYDYGGQSRRVDTVELLYGMELLEVLVSDTIMDQDHWTSEGLWSRTSQDYFSPEYSMTDSPEGNYSPGEDNSVRFAEGIYLPEDQESTLFFYAKWAIEPQYDYVVVEASSDELIWTPLCGLYTRLGEVNQLEGEPIYDGVQDEWVQEQMDLSTYAGDTIYIRFRLVSDQFVQDDGFYFDDFQVVSYKNPLTTATRSLPHTEDFTIYPNPLAERSLHVKSSTQWDEVRMMDVNGRSLQISGISENEVFLPQGLPDGLYVLFFYAEGKLVSRQKLAVSSRD